MPLKTTPFFGEYTLRYDWEAYEKLCEVLGVDTFAEFDEVLRKPGPRHIRVMLWAGLLHIRPELKPEYTGNIITEFLEDGNNLSGVSIAISNGLKEGGFIGDRGNDPGEVQQKPKLRRN